MGELAIRMRIIYIHQYFRTPEEGGATRSYYLAKGLAKAGHEVMVISGGGEKYDLKRMNGFTVHYLPVSYTQEFGFTRRIFAFLNYIRLAKNLIRKLPRADLFYISSTPLTTGWIGLWAKKKFAVPYIFEVRDLWPEAPIQVGAIRHPFLISYLKKQEKRIYENALQLVGLSPGMVNHIHQTCPGQSVHLIPNFSNPETFFPQEKRDDVLKKYGLEKELTIAYTGAIGRVNAVEELLDFSEYAQNEGKAWQFVIMGAGSEKKRLERIAEERQLSRVHFIQFGSKQKVNEVLGIADFAWISFADLPVLSTNSPNKFFDALAAGKAILINHKGWVHRLVKENELGFSVFQRKWEKLYLKLEEVEQGPKQLQSMQQNSLKLSTQFFTHQIAVERLLYILEPEKYPLTPAREAYIRIA